MPIPGQGAELDPAALTVAQAHEQRPPRRPLSGAEAKAGFAIVRKLDLGLVPRGAWTRADSIAVLVSAAAISELRTTAIGSV